MLLITVYNSAAINRPINDLQILVVVLHVLVNANGKLDLANQIRLINIKTRKILM